MAAVTDWGPVLFATVLPMSMLMLGGLVHVVFRLGRTEERVHNLAGDIEDNKDDIRYLTRMLTGRPSPSESRNHYGAGDDD